MEVDLRTKEEREKEACLPSQKWVEEAFGDLVEEITEDPSETAMSEVDKITFFMQEVTKLLNTLRIDHCAVLLILRSLSEVISRRRYRTPALEHFISLSHILSTIVTTGSAAKDYYFEKMKSFDLAIARGFIDEIEKQYTAYRKDHPLEDDSVDAEKVKEQVTKLGGRKLPFVVMES